MKFFLIVSLLFLASCASVDYQKREAEKTAKSRSAVERINSSSESNKSILKDLDD